ncbi:MAG: SpoIIE family protein phosphatase [Bryobacteraceae bacterium]|jgi:sigma-B regulation protein RsbU (phosphoserine phosphatase)
MNSNRRAYALLILVFALSFGYWIGGAFGLAGSLRFGQLRARRPFDFGFRMQAVSGMMPEARDAGAHMGDRLLQFGGQPFAGYRVMRDTVRQAHPGDVIPALMARPDGTRLPIAIRLAAEREGPAPVSEWIRDIAVQLLFPLFCLGLGFWVAAVRPNDRNAWLLLALMISLEFLVPNEDWGDPWWLLSAVWAMLAGFSWPIWMMLFGVHFPERSKMDIRRPWIKWIVLLPAVCSAVAVIVFQIGKEYSFASVEWLRSWVSPLDTVRIYAGMAGISLFFANVGEKRATASNKDSQRRIRLVLVGAAAGLTPCFIVVLVGLFRGADFGYGVPAWALYLAFGCLAIFPLTLAYVIVVQRAMEVRVAIRQSVQYTLARGGLWLLRVAMFSLAFKIFVDVSLDRNGFTFGTIGLLALGALLLTLQRRYRARVQGWVDRRFFREAYRTEQVLSDLSNEARNFVDARPLLATVTRRIAETLHVLRISVLLRAVDGFRLEPDSTSGSAPVVLETEARSIAQLRTARAPVTVYFDEPDAWLRAAPAPECRALRDLDAQLLLPLAGRNDLIGLMALGPKRSEEPYSRTDLQLLQSVADQTGLAIENSRLLSSLAEEAARRERFNRELEIAREVQERLFPQCYPAIPGLDCAGHCRPALGVGGDYYDFIALPEGRLGIAVGDVSGKGISAALLMASLRASLRGQTLGGPADLAALMRNVNALLYEASAANRYATFFYAQYDPRDRMLSFVNAGHNPPAVLRGDEVLRLEADGPVVGLLPGIQFRQSSLAMQAGDILLAYTDGISEAMTADDEEWGEDRMIAAAQAYHRETAARMIEQLMGAADEFAGGAPQHDDMTLVVMKLLA